MDSASLASTVVSVVALGGALVGAVVTVLGGNASKRDVERERSRILVEVLPSSGIDATGDRSFSADSEKGQDSNSPSESEQFTRLLVDYYAHGLAQAKRNSVASLGSSILGSGVLLTGVTLAIFNAHTSGQQYAAIVVTLAGVVTNAIGVLFHRQANRALTHMEGQTRLLRQDMRSEREARQAVELLSDVEDRGLRDRLRAALVLRLADATFPDTAAHLPNGHTGAVPSLGLAGLTSAAGQAEPTDDDSLPN